MRVQEDPIMAHRHPHHHLPRTGGGVAAAAVGVIPQPLLLLRLLGPQCQRLFRERPPIN